MYFNFTQIANKLNLPSAVRAKLLSLLIEAKKIEWDEYWEILTIHTSANEGYTFDPYIFSTRRLLAFSWSN